LAEYLLVKNTPIEKLEAALIEGGMIKKDSSIEDVVSDDLLLTAWDLSHRSPRFFTKWSYKNIDNNLYKGTHTITA